MLIKRVKLLLSMTLICIGAILIAPSASASEANYYEDLAREVCEHYQLNYDDCSWIGTSTWNGATDQNTRKVFVRPNDSGYIILQYSVNSYGNGTNNGVLFNIVGSSTYPVYCLNDVTDSLTTPRFTYNTDSYNVYSVVDGANDFVIPLTWYGNYDDDTFYDDVIIRYGGASGFTGRDVADYNQISTVNNVQFTNVKGILTEYLDAKGWQVPSAYLAESTSNGFTQTKPLNVVTHAQDLPEGYEGLYCIMTKYDTFYKFQVAITAGSNPNDYSDFWDDYLILQFNTSSLTNVTCYFGYDYNSDPRPLCLRIGSNSWETDFTATPMSISTQSFNGVAIGTSYEISTTPIILVGERWRYNNTISNLYVAWHYSNTVNGTVTDGNGSDEYNTYETNYYDNLYNQTIAGLTGVDNGADNFSADWAGGEMPDTTIDYNDTPTFDDAGLGSFFLRIWTVGNGYFTTVLLSVLSVAFVAYLIYGRS